MHPNQCRENKKKRKQKKEEEVAKRSGLSDCRCSMFIHFELLHCHCFDGFFVLFHFNFFFKRAKAEKPIERTKQNKTAVRKKKPIAAFLRFSFYFCHFYVIPFWFVVSLFVFFFFVFLFFFSLSYSIRCRHFYTSISLCANLRL